MAYKEGLSNIEFSAEPQLVIPQKRGFLPSEGSEYRISDEAVRKLNTYVADLKAHPKGTLVGKIVFEDLRPMLNRRVLVATLPAGLPEDKFVDVIRLSFHVESATDSYAEVFYQSGRRFDQPWLGEFTRDVWVPDEYEHADPFKRVLLEFGYTEEELDRQAQETRDKLYEHTSGDTPVQMTQFGFIQEEITDVWHGLAGSLLQEASPELAENILRTKKRETLHKIWYKDLTAIQIADNPKLRVLANDTLCRFKMPGNKIVPQLQEGAVNLMPIMGRDFRELERGLVRLISSSLGNNTEYLGEAIIGLIERKAQETGITPIKLVKKVSNIPGLGRVVNLLAGQAIQEREGMKPQNLVEKIVWDMTSPIRSLIVKKAEGLNPVT